jgi:SAM-dependent methyltransferase
MSALHNALKYIPADIKCKLDFLELGYFEIENVGNNFANVEGFKSKESVDMDNQNATYHMLTDDFFAQNKKTYDLIYIDAGHHWENVHRDYNNAIKILNKGGIIFFHDLYPPPELSTPQYCWDGYKLLNYFHKHTDQFDYLTYKPDVGTTILTNKFPEIPYESVDQVTYKEFCANICTSGFITEVFEEFVEKLVSHLK